MTKIKSVYFVDGKEMERVKEERSNTLHQYLGMVTTCCCGRGINLTNVANKGNKSFPSWIMLSILTYLEKSCLGKTIIHQDYAFFIHLFDDKCFIEMTTTSVIKG